MTSASVTTPGSPVVATSFGHRAQSRPGQTPVWPLVAQSTETLQNWQRIIDINLLGAVRRCRTFTPMLKAQHSGHLVKSLAGWARPPTGYVVLQCGKACVVALSDSRSFERQPFGIATSVVCPAFLRPTCHCHPHRPA